MKSSLTTQSLSNSMLQSHKEECFECTKLRAQLESARLALAEKDNALVILKCQGRYNQETEKVLNRAISLKVQPA